MIRHAVYHTSRCAFYYEDWFALDSFRRCRLESCECLGIDHPDCKLRKEKEVLVVLGYKGVEEKNEC